MVPIPISVIRRYCTSYQQISLPPEFSSLSVSTKLSLESRSLGVYSIKMNKIGPHSIQSMEQQAVLIFQECRLICKARSKGVDISTNYAIIPNYNQFTQCIFVMFQKIAICQMKLASYATKNGEQINYIQYP